MICFLNLQLFLNFTAKGCLKKVVDYGKSVLSESLASLFEFSLTLPSASPRLVLYRQLAEDSLSLFPLADDVSSNIVNESDFDPNDKIKDKKSEPLLLGINPGAPSGKCCWVDVGSMIFFDVPSFQSWLQGHKSVTDGDFQQPELFEIDHIHPHSSIGSPVAILYGALGLDCFKDFHVALVHAARQGKVTYVVRPLLASGCESKLGSCGAIGTKGPVNLVGYGVELALKNMEYKAMDDSSVKKGTLAAAYDMIVSEVKWMGKPDKIIYTSDAEIVDTKLLSVLRLEIHFIMT